MWKRDTFKNCGLELLQLSEQFRSCHQEWKDQSTPAAKDKLIEVSVKGRDLLDILALTIRREMDEEREKLTTQVVVGYLNENVKREQQNAFIKDYAPDHPAKKNFEALSLRDACNKIAHTKISSTGFFVNDERHDVILCGKYYGKNWIAVIDIPKFANCVQELPEIKRPDTFGVFDDKNII